MLFDRPEKDTLEKIKEIVIWYYNNPNCDDIELLNENRNKLTALCVFLSELVAKSGMKSELSTLSRRMVLASRTNDFKSKKEIKTVKEAENSALTSLEKEYRQDKIEKSKTERLFLLLKQCNMILSAMYQSISLKSKEQQNIKAGG